MPFWTYTLLNLLAEDKTNPIASFEGWASVAGALVISVGGLSAVVMLMFRGLWAKMGEPVVKAMFTAWLADKDQIAGREADIKKVIDNEIQRKDGLIYKEITSQVNTMQQALLKAIQSVSEEIREDTDELKRMVSSRVDLEDDFRTNLTSRLGKIEGALGVLSRGKLSSTSDSMPAQGGNYPQRGGPQGGSYVIKDPEGTGRFKPQKP